MKKVLIVAGEASGDLHAAALISQTLNKNPGIQFYGIGGDKMKAAGADIIIDNRVLSVLGLIELIKDFSKLHRAFATIRDILNHNPPDLLILVDFPEFNLRLAKIAKQNNIKVLYYISPQLWAWRKGRIHLIKSCIDKMAVIFPFEVDFYKEHQISATYVGNPLAEHVKPTLSIAQTCEKYVISTHQITIGLLPGSRKNELKYIFPTILKSAKLLTQKYPRIQFVLPLAPTLSEKQLEPYLKKCSLPIKIIQNDTYNVVQLCDAVITASGTVTLEIALLGIPMVILYRFAVISALVALILIDVEHIGLCNIIANKMVAREFIQYRANPKNIVREISKILEDKKYNNTIRQEFSLLKDKLTNHPDQQKIEHVIVELLK